MSAPRRTGTLIAGTLAGLLATFAVVPASASSRSGFVSNVSAGVVTLRSGPAGGAITLSVHDGRLRHDARAGDGFDGAFDFDTGRAGVQQVRAAGLRMVRVQGGAGSDFVSLAAGRGYPSLVIDGGPGRDTVTTLGAVRARGAVTIEAERIRLGAPGGPGRSPLTVASPFTASGDITLSTTDSGPGPTDDNLTVTGSGSVTSTGGSVTLRSAYAVDLQAGSSVTAANNVVLQSDASNTDTPSNGDVLVDGSVQAQAGSVSVTTGAADDTVRLAGSIASGTTSSISTGAGADTVDVRGATVFPGTADGGGSTDLLDFTNAGS